MLRSKSPEAQMKVHYYIVDIACGLRVQTANPAPKRETQFVGDSSLGSIWRMPRDEAAAETWFAHDWLAGCGDDDPIGANGVA
jgi:hypothetical protein